MLTVHKKEVKTTLTQVKMPEGLTRVCRERGVLTLVKFYYQLKTLTIEGFIPKGKALPMIQKKYPQSTSQVYVKLKKLSELGFVRINRTGYSLVSYDSLFKSLGYTRSYKRTKTNQVRHNNFKLQKFSTSELEYCYDELDQIEVIKSLQKQAYRIKSSKVTMPNIRNDYVDMNKGSRLVYFPNIKGTLEERGIQCMNLFMVKDVNTDITLSCSGVARCLGFRSSNSGWRWETILFRPIKRCVLVIKELNKFLGTQMLKSLTHLSPNFFYDEYSGGIYYRLSNQF